VAEATTYVQALNGAEIIDDLCGAIAEKLRVDCNLREIDGYASGYKAKVTIHLECFGLDTAVVDQEVVLDETASSPENPLQEPDDVIDTEIEIPQETNLKEVRDRSGQTEASMEITPDGPTEIPRRKYSRRIKALAQAQGGATGPLNE
jgi:hypothetical protein